MDNNTFDQNQYSNNYDNMSSYNSSSYNSSAPIKPKRRGLRAVLFIFFGLALFCSIFSLILKEGFFNVKDLGTFASEGDYFEATKNSYKKKWELGYSNDVNSKIESVFDRVVDYIETSLVEDEKIPEIDEVKEYMNKECAKEFEGHEDSEEIKGTLTKATEDIYKKIKVNWLDTIEQITDRIGVFIAFCIFAVVVLAIIIIKVDNDTLNSINGIATALMVVGLIILMFGGETIQSIKEDPTSYEVDMTDEAISYVITTFKDEIFIPMMVVGGIMFLGAMICCVKVSRKLKKGSKQDGQQL